MQTMQELDQQVCSCGSIGRTELRQCPTHYHLWNGDQRLASVGSIIRQCFPQPTGIPPEVLENARDRGTVLDRLAAAYVTGNLRTIPAGTRRDAVDLFLKFRRWFDKQNFKSVEAQVVLGLDDHGGVVDFVFDGVPVDLKGTYNIEHTHRLQVAAYACLHGLGDADILHITERIDEPRRVAIKQPDYDDWRIMLAHWRMLQRRAK